METVVRTGVDGRMLTIDDELRAVVNGVRQQERAVAARLGALSHQRREVALRTLVACGIAQVEDWAQDAEMPAGEFASRCVTLRGPLNEGFKRKHMRELARLYLLLSAGERPPIQRSEHRELWEKLQRDEPYLYAPHKTSNYRTDYVPFTLYLDSTDDLDSGLATVPQEDIQHEVDALLAYLGNNDVDRELRATSAYYLHSRIHPFFDGNGHVGRALACLALGDGYSAYTKLAFVRAIQGNRGRTEDAFKQVAAGHDDLRSATLFLLSLLVTAQRGPEWLNLSGWTQLFGHSQSPVRQKVARCESVFARYLGFYRF